RMRSRPAMTRAAAAGPYRPEPMGLEVPDNEKVNFPSRSSGGRVTEVADMGTMLPAHRAAVEQIKRDYAAIPPGSPVRLAKRTSNLFRFRGETAGPALDVSAFGRVLRVDPAARTAIVGGMTTYEDLADATLMHGLMPLV